MHRPGQVVQNSYSGIDGDGHCDSSDTINNGLLFGLVDLEDSQNISFTHHWGSDRRNNHI